MSFRTLILPAMLVIRTIPGPTVLDLRTTKVEVVKRTWVGGRKGAPGGYSDIDLELVPRPRVVQLSQREIASSGGRYEDQSVRIKWIQPDCLTGGFTPQDVLQEQVVDGIEIFYRLSSSTGGINANYTRVGSDTARWGHITLVLNQRRDTPGDQ